MTDMINGIASGLNALMNEYDAVSHNIANSNTAGFKKRLSTFSTEVQNFADENFNPLAGSIDWQTKIDFSQGPLKRTDRPLDVAMEGKGLLVLDSPNGRLYTRNGSLQINILGQLADMNGHLVSGKNGPITVPRSVSDSDIQIDGSGTVRAGQTELGQLEIVEFENIDQLKPAGNNCFRGPEDMSLTPAENTFIRQGYCEDSNVQAVQELTNLLTISRLFEANTDFLKKQSENSQTILGVANS
ncbi:MAG: flagellar hook-basal body protein [Planctomycetota bacterium]|jgi:flagellar basal-body rod protein FlgF